MMDSRRTQYVVWNMEQGLSDSEQAQARNNIGAAAASDVTTLRNDVDALSNASVYTTKGEATVAELNAGPAGIQPGWSYILTDAGTLTDGSLAVKVGDTVAWDGTKWFALVSSQIYASKTDFDNISASIAPEYDSAIGAIAGNRYMHEGSLYICEEDTSGSWNASKFKLISIDNTLKNVKYDDVCFTFGNLFDKESSDIVVGALLNPSGTTSSNNDYNTTGFIPVHGGINYYVLNGFRVVAAYDSLKNVIDYLSTTDSTKNKYYKTPVNACYLRFSIYIGYWASLCVSANKSFNNAIEDHPFGYVRIPKDFIDKSFLKKNDYQSIPFYMLKGFSSGNLKDYIISVKNGYYVDQSGSSIKFESSSSYNSVVIAIPSGYTGKVSWSGTTRFAVLCEKSGLRVGSVSSSVNSLDVVDSGDEKFLVITYYSSVDLNTIVITLGASPSNEVSTPSWLGVDAMKADITQLQSDVSNIGVDNNPKSLSVVSSTPSVGDSLIINDALCEAKKVQAITFSGTLDGTFVDIKIGWANSSGVFKHGIKITPLQIIPVSNETEGSASTSNLSIVGNLQVKIINKASYIGFTITSGGDKIESSSFANFLVAPNSHYKPCVVIDSPMVDCKLSWTLQHMDAKILVMGDSYCGVNDPGRWPTYLLSDEYDKKTVINAYSGEGYSNAIESLTNLLKTMKPKYIVWCLGMNDGSDSLSAPSANWVTGRDAFIALCEQCGAEPVFGTIPTVPSINNEKKNEWIRASGKRYIDFAKAVGANSSGVWYAGMLYTDNVHPTAKGAKALYAQALTDFPEFLIT